MKRRRCKRTSKTSFLPRFAIDPFSNDEFRTGAGAHVYEKVDMYGKGSLLSVISSRLALWAFSIQQRFPWQTILRVFAQMGIRIDACPWCTAEPNRCPYLALLEMRTFLSSLRWRLGVRAFGAFRRLLLGQRFIHALLEVTLVVVREPAIHRHNTHLARCTNRH